MRRWGRVGMVIVAVTLALACGSKKRQARTTDAAPVEPITAPPPSDATAGAPRGAADEVEPNDTEDTALELALGGSIHGRIDPEGDADAYRIEVPGPGVLAVEVSGVRETDLTLELHDGTGAVVARSDRGTANTKEAIPNFAVTKGRYVAIVRGKKLVVRGKPVKPASPVLPYDVTASLIKPAANAEKEPDDDRGTANELILGDPVTGMIGWTGDLDTWKLALEALSAKNVIDIELGAVEGVALTVELADAVGRPLVVRKGARGGPVNVRGLLPELPTGAPPYQYLTIKGTPSNPETAYALRVVPRNLEGSDAEIEPNDTIDKPMPIPADRTRVDAQWSPGDIDCFSIAPDGGNRTLEVTIEAPAEADLSAELVVDGKAIAKSEVKGKGATEKLKGAVPANARAIIRVWGSDAGGEGTYEVKVSEK